MRTFLKSSNQRGAAAVEFAILLPLLLFLFLGITEFGVAYYNKQILTNASREGARIGIVKNTTDQVIKNTSYDYAKDRLITFGANTFSTNSIEPDRSDTGYLKVSVSFDYSYLLLAGFKFFGADFGPSLAIGASTVMRVEN